MVFYTIYLLAYPISMQVQKTLNEIDPAFIFITWVYYFVINWLKSLTSIITATTSNRLFLSVERFDYAISKSMSFPLQLFGFFFDETIEKLRNINT